MDTWQMGLAVCLSTGNPVESPLFISLSDFSECRFKFEVPFSITGLRQNELFHFKVYLQHVEYCSLNVVCHTQKLNVALLFHDSPVRGGTTFLRKRRDSVSFRGGKKPTLPEPDLLDKHEFLLRYKCMPIYVPETGKKNLRLDIYELAFPQVAHLETRLVLSDKNAPGCMWNRTPINLSGAAMQLLKAFQLDHFYHEYQPSPRARSQIEKYYLDTDLVNLPAPLDRPDLKGLFMDADEKDAVRIATFYFFTIPPRPVVSSLTWADFEAAYRRTVALGKLASKKQDESPIHTELRCVLHRDSIRVIFHMLSERRLEILQITPI